MMLVRSFFTHSRLRAHRAPAFPAPSVINRRERLLQNLGRNAEIAESYFEFGVPALRGAKRRSNPAAVIPGRCAEHRTRNCQIPRCAIAHLRSGAGAPSRKNGFWIASRGVSSGARSRDPLARNHGFKVHFGCLNRIRLWPGTSNSHERKAMLPGSCAGSVPAIGIAAWGFSHPSARDQGRAEGKLRAKVGRTVGSPLWRGCGREYRLVTSPAAIWNRQAVAHARELRRCQYSRYHRRRKGRGSHFERDHVSAVHRRKRRQLQDLRRQLHTPASRASAAVFRDLKPSRQRLRAPVTTTDFSRFGHCRLAQRGFGVRFSVLAACSASTAAASMSSDRAGEGEGDRVASSAACEGAASLSSNSSIRSATRSNAALNAARGAVKEISSAARLDGADLGIEEIADPAVGTISRHRKLISLITRALLRTGARFSSSARLSSAADAADLASSSARLMAVNASASPLSGAGCLWAARLLRSAPPHRAPCKCRHYGCAWHIHSGTSGPASLHEGLAHRLIIFLARQAGASGNRR